MCSKLKSNHSATYLARIGYINAIIGPASCVAAVEVVIRPSVQIFVNGTTRSIACPAYLTFTSFSFSKHNFEVHINGNQIALVVVGQKRRDKFTIFFYFISTTALIVSSPISVAASMLTHRISITDRTIWTHARYLGTAISGISSKAPRARALVASLGVDAVRVWATSSDALATLVNVVATLPLEWGIDCRWHVNATTVIAMKAWGTRLTAESWWEIGAANARIAWLEEVALARREKKKKFKSYLWCYFCILETNHLINVNAARSITRKSAWACTAFKMRMMICFNALDT